MDSFKQWFQLEIASTIGTNGEPSHPVADFGNLRDLSTDYFSNAPEGAKDMQDLTAARPSQLPALAPRIGSNIIKFAGPDGKGFSPMQAVTTTLDRLGKPVPPKMQPLMKKIAMRKFIKKMNK